MILTYEEILKTVPAEIYKTSIVLFILLIFFVMLIYCINELNKYDLEKYCFLFILPAIVFICLTITSFNLIDLIITPEVYAKKELLNLEKREENRKNDMELAKTRTQLLKY